MFRGIELLLFRLVVWIALPVLLIVLLLGPARVLNWLRHLHRALFDRRHDPAAVLDRVVRQHQQHIAALRKVIDQADSAKREIELNQQKSNAALAQFEAEAAEAVQAGDDLGARGALYRLNLERVAVQSFGEQLTRVDQRIEQARKRLYLLDLQLRQYEVGKTILLSQLAEAKTVEQQYSLVNQFDPFSAVAAWQETEGLVRAATQQARAADRVLQDTAELPLAGQASAIDPATLDAQLLELKSKKGNHRNGAA